MMSFKEFFVLQERKYIANNMKKFFDMIQDLKNQIQADDDFGNKSKYYLDFDENNSLSVGFVNKLPKGWSQNANAVYDPDESLILVSLDNLLQGQYIRNKFEYIKKAFPSDLESIIAHELYHAWEDMIKSEEVGKPSLNSINYTSEEEGIDKYLNSESELKSNLVEIIYLIMRTNKLARLYLRRGEVNKATELTVELLNKYDYIKLLSDKNKKRLYSLIYTTLWEVVHK